MDQFVSDVKASSDHYFHKCCLYNRLFVRCSKTKRHYRPEYGSGRVDQYRTCFEYFHIFFRCFLIHSANPKSRPVGTIVFGHVRPSVRTYVRPNFSNLEKQNNRKQCSLLAWLWVLPSGSLMTPVLWNPIFGEKNLNSGNEMCLRISGKIDLQ